MEDAYSNMVEILMSKLVGRPLGGFWLSCYNLLCERLVTIFLELYTLFQLAGIIRGFFIHKALLMALFSGWSLLLTTKHMEEELTYSQIKMNKESPSFREI